MNSLIFIMLGLPWVGVLALMVLPSSPLLRGGGWNPGKGVALLCSLGAGLTGSFLVLSKGLSDPSGIYWSQSLAWLGSYNINYDLRLDGLNGPLVLLVSIIFPIILLSEWNQKYFLRGLFGIVLVLQSSAYGLICADDLFLLFFFLALSALPFYFWLAMWGDEGREAAASQSGLVMALGNALMFISFVLVYFAADPHGFSLTEINPEKLREQMILLFGREFRITKISFLLFCAGVALRVPVWPIQSWFVAAMKQAPATYLMAACGVFVPLLMGIFAKVSYLLFREELMYYSDLLFWIFSLNLLFGAVTSVIQRDLRIFFGYVCMFQVSVVGLGIVSQNPTALVGSLVHMVSVGIALTGFGVLVSLARSRVGHCKIEDDSGKLLLGGVVTQAPLFGLASGVFLYSLVGFPGLGGFIGQTLIVIGNMATHPVVAGILVVSLAWLTWSVYSLYHRIFLAAEKQTFAFPDLTGIEKATVGPLIVALVVLGLYPALLLRMIEPAVDQLLKR